MKLWMGSAFLCLLIAAPTFAHQEQQQDDKPKQQQDEKKKPPQEPKADKQQEQPARQQDDRAKQEDKKQEKQDTKQQEKQQKEMEKQQKAQERQPEQQRPTEQRQTQQQRAPEQRTDTGRNEQYAGGGERGRHIPDDRFREHFGREHHFHVGIHHGERQFAYGGYSFELVDAWPAVWGYDDDFYVDYIDDQYYLCDLDHPEVRIVVIVVS